MGEFDPPPLDYHLTPRGGARWAMASLGVAVGTVVFIVAIPLARRLFVGRIGGGQDSAVILIATIGLVAVVAPAAGVTLGALGLRGNVRRRWLAVVAILLNLSVWAIVVLVLLFMPR